MGAVTYPEPAIIEFLGREVVPLKINFDQEPLASQFWIRWTPALFMLDPYAATPTRATWAFWGPRSSSPTCFWAWPRTYFAHRRFNDALALLERLLSDHSQSFCAPESVYLRAICRYRTSQDHHHLRVDYQILSAEYPASDHAQRAQPYRVLP